MFSLNLSYTKSYISLYLIFSLFLLLYTITSKDVLVGAIYLVYVLLHFVYWIRWMYISKKLEDLKVEKIQFSSTITVALFLVLFVAAALNFGECGFSYNTLLHLIQMCNTNSPALINQGTMSDLVIIAYFLFLTMYVESISVRFLNKRLLSLALVFFTLFLTSAPILILIINNQPMFR